LLFYVATFKTPGTELVLDALEQAQGIS
jgi:hypothetical protein